MEENLGDYYMPVIQTLDSGFSLLGCAFSFADAKDYYYLLRLENKGNINEFK